MPDAPLPELARGTAGRKRELGTIVRGAGISFAGNVSFLILSIAFQWLLAHTLGPANVGIIGLALALFQLGMVASEFGLQSAAMRYVALYMDRGDRARAAGVIIASVSVTGVLGLIIGAALFGAADLLAAHVFHKPPLAPPLRILTVGVPFMAVTTVLVFAMRGLKRVEGEAVISQIVIPLLKIGGLIAVVYFVGSSVVGVAYALLTVTIIGTVLASVVMWRLYPLRGWSGRPILATSTLLAFSWPLLLNQIVVLAIKELETLVLGVWVTSDQVGIYYVGLRTTVLIGVFLSAFSTIFAPVMAALHDRQEHELFGSLLKTVTKWGLGLCLPIFLVFFLFSEQVLLIFGADFARGAMVLQVLALSELFNVAVGPVGWALTMTGYPRLNLLNGVLLLTIDLALALLLIPQYGIVGAAISGALTMFAINLLRLFEVYVILRVHPYNRSYLKLIAAGILGAIALLGVRVLFSGLPAIGQVSVAALVSLLVYTASLLVMRLDEDDRWVLDALQRRLVGLVPGKAGNG